MEESEQRKPRHPSHDLFHMLHIENTEYEDEFIEDEVPEFILQMLFLGKAEMTKHQKLN